MTMICSRCPFPSFPPQTVPHPAHIHLPDSDSESFSCGVRESQADLEILFTLLLLSGAYAVSQRKRVFIFSLFLLVPAMFIHWMNFFQEKRCRGNDGRSACRGFFCLCGDHYSGIFDSGNRGHHGCDHGCHLRVPAHGFFLVFHFFRAGIFPARLISDGGTDGKCVPGFHLFQLCDTDYPGVWRYCSVDAAGKDPCFR